MWIGTLPRVPAGNTVTALAFSADARTLYTGDAHGYVRAWDLARHTHSRVFRRREGGGYRHILDFHQAPDGSRLFVDEGGRLVDALDPGRGAVVECGAGYGPRWHLLPGGRRALCNGPGDRLALWDLGTGRRLKLPPAVARLQGVGDARVLPGETTLLTFRYCTIEKRTLELWDLRTGGRFGHLAPAPFGLVLHDVSPDGRSVVAYGDGRLWLYDLPSRKPRGEVEASRLQGVARFHPNGRLLAGGSRVGVLLVDTDAMTVSRELELGIGEGRWNVFSPDGLTCAACGNDGQFAVFDVDL